MQLFWCYGHKTRKIKKWKKSYCDKLSSSYIMLLIHLGFPSLTIFKGQGKTAYPTFKICLLSCLLPRHLKINSDWDPVKILLIFQEFKKPEKKGLLHSVSKSAPENCNLSLKLLIACMHKYHSLSPIFCPILICVYYFPAQEAYKSIFWIKQRERKKKKPHQNLSNVTFSNNKCWGGGGGEEYHQ